ncbi:MAG: ImmA/IrrE family metallo-endopeptidase [Candidatus Sumerlaeota bacterium]|nr:ImmA/IrrE family metallo-endopeptidase [Candidatus Sumerlaeota bacterium]
MRGFPKSVSRFSRTDIQKQADDFRAKHWPSGALPVDIEIIIERLGMDIEPLHNLKESCDITACLCPDLKTIAVDMSTMMDQRQLVYYRFSLAHEIGHLILHKDFFEWQYAQNLKTISQWIEFVKEANNNLFPDCAESDANEFAGRLLVPRDQLKKETERLLSQISKEDLAQASDDAVRKHIASRISRPFLVSSQTIAIRLEREGLYP